KQFKLPFAEMDDVGPIVLDGRAVSDTRAKTLWEEIEAATGKMDADAATIADKFAPWAAPNAEALDRRSLADWIASLDVSPLCRAGVEADFVADNGVIAAWQSYLGNLAMVRRGDGDYGKGVGPPGGAGGNRRLAEPRRDRIGAPRTPLQSPVPAIAASDRGVAVSTAAARHEADYAVLSVPPSTWNRIAF